MSKFKASNGVYLTQGLFYEWNNPNAEFSLRDTGQEEYYVARSGKKYRSLPYIFRNSNSEYECAITTLGSWEHWKKLCSQEWFVKGTANGNEYTGLNDWRAEKQLADENAAKKILMEAIADGDVQAAKFMYGEAKKTANTDAKKAGRPEKKVPTKTPSSVVALAKRIGEK